MKKPPSIHLWITIPLLLLAGCSKGLEDFSAQEIVDEDILFAQRLFEEEVGKISGHLTKSTASDIHPTHLFQPGTIAPDWTGSEKVINRKSKSNFIEVPLTTTFRYRALQYGPEAKKPRRVKAYHELLIAFSSDHAKNGVFIVFHIASNNYIKWHKGILSQRFSNSGDMKNYSGLKIYTDLEGRIVRINKYTDGKKVTGIFVPNYKSAEQKELRHAFIVEQFKNIRFQYGLRISPPTRSQEDDDSWSYYDWDTDSYDDDHYFAPEDEIDSGYCSSGDNDFWGEGFGDDDSGFDPDDDNGYWDWNDDYDLLYNNEQNDSDDGEVVKEGPFGNQSEKKTLDYANAQKKYEGYDVHHDCFLVAKGVMEELGYKGEINRYQRIQLVSSSGNSLIGNILDAIKLIISNLDKGNPVMVGMNYKSGYNDPTDQITDHYIVIIGYHVVDEDNVIFRFVETGRETDKKDEAFSEERALVYQNGNDKISANHWRNNYKSYYATHVRKNTGDY